jgi:hypothetical protein
MSMSDAVGFLTAGGMRGIVVGPATGTDAQVLVDLGAAGCLPCFVPDHVTSAGPLNAGDAVVVLTPAVPGDPGVVLGTLRRSGRERAPQSPAEQSEGPSPAPPVLVIEATEELTLRVGDGSITIRKDGKILIKGRDLVSHAQRMNRIKGGAVSIN